MKKYITRLLAFSMVLIITFVLVELSNAAGTPAPGSNDDPLVTKSYIDKEIKDLDKEIDTLLKSLNAANKTIKTLKSQISTLTAKVNSGNGNYFNVPKGKILTLSKGAMLVLYSGSCSINGSKLANITNLTNGKYLKVGQAAPVRHLLFSTTSDGRGVKAKTDILVYVSGDYKIN